MESSQSVCIEPQRTTAPVHPNSTSTTEPSVTNRPILAWSIVAIGFAIAAFCRISLTWDGSYYLFNMLQEGEPFMPHRRWFDWLLQMPVLWARPFVGTPSALSVILGFTCFLVPLLSLAACFAMLSGKYSRLRIWAMIGVILVPFPGQLPIVSEATPTTQLLWVLLCFAWIGCPAKWSPAAAVAMLAMGTLHPVASPAFALAAALTFAIAWMNPAVRNRALVWAGIFCLASAAKAAESIMFATPYERGQFDVGVFRREFVTALLFSPLPFLLPVLLERLIAVVKNDRAGISTSRLLWGVAILIGAIQGFFPGQWASSLDYRKFGLFVAIPFVLMGTWECWQVYRNATSVARSARISLVPPALLFLVMISLISWNWEKLCHSLQTRLSSSGTDTVVLADLPKPESYSALNHWSMTSLAFVLQGSDPQKLFIWDKQRQASGSDLCICPGTPVELKDAGLRLSKFKPIVHAAPQ